MREEHTFTYTAMKISTAASAEEVYHDSRITFWNIEYAKAIERVRKTASIEIKEVEITGGKRADVVINYGDLAAYHRMGEAFSKIQSHREEAERYRTEAMLYASQPGGREYELSADDVHYFRLAGDPRPE